MKRIIFLLIIFFSLVEVKAQLTYNILEFKDLGFFNKDSTFGGFKSDIGYLKVKITDYSYNKKTFLLTVTGNISEYINEETFCDVFAFTGKPYKKEKKLTIFETFKVDCLGNFNFTMKVEPEVNLYFWYYGCSLLQCEIDKKKL